MSNPPLLSPLIPRQAVPPLQVPTLDHGNFTLSEDAAANFTLVVFYRGLHCPICLKYLLELGRLQPSSTSAASRWSPSRATGANARRPWPTS